jgi:hypothetical protein
VAPSKPSGERFKVFVSYSRADYPMIWPLTQLLRLNANGPIFLDKDSIPPGAEWNKKISTAIRRCSSFVIFWCTHSLQSNEVRKEYELAISSKKDIVPVLLDKSELPDTLKRYQWIDLSASLHTQWVQPVYPPPGSAGSAERWEPSDPGPDAYERHVFVSDVESAVEQIRSALIERRRLSQGKE